MLWGVIEVLLVVIAVPALLGLMAAWRRTAPWVHTFAFAVAYLVAATAADSYGVYVLGCIDDKFRNAPIYISAALLSSAVFSVPPVVLLLGCLSFLARRNFIPPALWPLTSVAGALCGSSLWVFDMLHWHLIVNGTFVGLMIVTLLLGLTARGKKGPVNYT